MLKTLKDRKYLWPIYLITFLDGIYFILPIWLFFYLRFLDYKQIAIITVIQTLTAIIFELPTGALADLIGRKKSIFASYFLYTIAMLGFVFFNKFWIFIILEIVKGISKAMYSGCNEALIYDTLKDHKDEEAYPKVSADLESLMWIGLFISSFLGGIFYDIWFRLPHLLVVINYLIVTIIIFVFIKEPSVDSEKFYIKKYIHQNINGFKELFKDYSTAITVAIFLTVSLGYITASELLGISQANDYGFSGKQVGFLFGTGYIISAIASQIFPKLKTKFGHKKILFFIVPILLISFLGATYVPASIGCILIIARISSSATFRNTRTNILNRFISSKNRATALSTFQFILSLIFTIIIYFVGDYIDKTSPNEFAFLFGLWLTLILIILFILYTLHTKKTYKSKQS